MSGPDWTVIDRNIRRLERAGMCDVRGRGIGPGKAEILFHTPLDGPLLEQRDIVSDIIIYPDTTVDTFAIRFPGVPEDAASKTEVRSSLIDPVEVFPYPKVEERVRGTPGDVWLPHADYKGGDLGAPLGEVVGYIPDAVDAYKESLERRFDLTVTERPC